MPPSTSPSTTSSHGRPSRTSPAPVPTPNPTPSNLLPPSSDPASIRIELVNNVVHPPFALVVAPSVNTADLKYTLKPQSNVTTGTAFQINFVGTSGQNTGIVAQSPQFTVAKVALSTTTASPTEGAGAASATASGAPAATTSGSAAGSVQVPAWAGAGAGVLAVGVAALLL